MSQNCSEEMEKYFEKIGNDVRQCYTIAEAARKKGFDPEKKVDIPLAMNMAERVIGLISAVAPQIIGVGIPERIQELEKQYGVLDWRISLIIAEEIANEKYCKFKDKLEAMETGIRVGLAYHTLGSVASPLEGLSRIKIMKRNDGKEFFALYYSGPIRSAGGTGGSVSVLIADYVRKKMGYDVYDPREEEVNRMVTELYDYHDRISNLQYLPSEDEIKFLMKHLPVLISGDPSEKIEVSNYKDLERIESNQIRNGPCLVLGECLAQKAKKLWKQLSKWGKDFGMEHWNFLKEFIEIQDKIKGKIQTVKSETAKIIPDYTYIKDLVAGRPVLSHPMQIGGFRLRYGRARTSGYSASAIHPATMYLLNNYIAIGTQLKVERPGKAAVISSCDTLEPPIVKLKNGSVLKVSSKKEIQEILPELQEIIFLGDILFNYGDFLNRNQKLAPAGYCPEWWIQELEKSAKEKLGENFKDKLSEITGLKKEEIKNLFDDCLRTRISIDSAIKLSLELKVPLHPDYTYYWRTINPDQFLSIIEMLKSANIKIENNLVQKIIFSTKQKEAKRVIELLGIPHIVVNNEFAVIELPEARAFAFSFGSLSGFDFNKIESIVKQNKDKNPLEIINLLAGETIRDKAGTFVGARMGRPEKAKQRKMAGSPHTLFPVGSEGGRLRCFQSALEIGKVTADFPIFYCEKCNKETIFSICEICDSPTTKMFFCKTCGTVPSEKCKHGNTAAYKNMSIDIRHYFESIIKKLDTPNYPDLIKGVRGTSNKSHIPEHLLKGIIRARHDIYVNKDGTTRYDITQMPLTHFKPKEIRTSIKKLKELGYTHDIYKNPLESDEQILELKPQDIVIPACKDSPDEGSDKVLFRVSKVCDDELKFLYGLEPYYNLKTEDDLAGHYLSVLAPHTSAAIVGRIIGFSQTQGCLAHPMMHAATRRDCDGDELSISLLLDVLLNFSRQYLPAHKGSTQDAPLVMTARVIPTEVDDMIFDMDTSWRYPLDFYFATLDCKSAVDISIIEKFGNRLNTPLQYEGIGFTHDTNNLNTGVLCSSYKILPSMEEKLKGQMDIADKVRAVDASDVARLVIEKHFIRDIKGNLRKFSTQEFRCVNCNEKFRRPPLIGRCTKCNGRIIFTISEGSVVKYLEPSMSLANKYNIPSYLKLSLELTKRRIESVFGKDKEKQEGLGKWFG